MSKYGNRTVTYQGIKFDSQRELERWLELKLLERAGEITDLQRQVKFELIPPQMYDGKIVFRKTVYIADFAYKEKNGNVVVEDAKGFPTEAYKIKRKLMMDRYGIYVREV